MTEARVHLDDFNTIPARLPDELDSWTPYYLSGVEDAGAVQPTLGHGLIYPGLRHVFSGPQESAKTLAAYSIGLDIITRHPDDTIILLDFEMGPRGAKRRWRDCGATDRQLDNNILYLAPDTHASLDRILILVALNPLLVIIDAAAGAFDNEDLDDNKRQDAERWRKLYVDPFFDNGIATLVLDHVVKNAESRGKYTIGSERKTGGGEVHIGFDTIKPIKRGSTGLYKMLLHKDREGHHERGHFCDLHVSSDPATHTLTCEFRPVEDHQAGDVWMPTMLMEKLSGVLETATEPMSRNQLELSVNGNADAKRKAIDHLTRLGYAAEEHGARRSRTYTHIRSFTVSEWEKQPDSSLRPTSSPLRPDEVHSTSSSSSPPTGDGRGGSPNGRPPLRPAEDDDLEVRAMLAHYDLLPPPEDTPADDDLPL